MPVDLDQQFDHFLDALRREQMSFLDSMRSLCMPLGSNSTALGAAANSQARLTQQFLDAQRSLLRRTAEYDTSASDIERSAADEARQMVIGAAKYALDCGVAAETLEDLRWTALDAALAADHDTEAVAIDVARRQQHELSALLDRWWAETQERGLLRVERANHFAGVVRGRADDRVSRILEAVARQAAPQALEAAGDAPALAPMDLLAAFDTADPNDLGSLLDGLVRSLGAEAAPTAEPLADSSAVALLADAEQTSDGAVKTDLDRLLEALEAEMATSVSTASLPDTMAPDIIVPDTLVPAAETALIQLGQRASEPSLERPLSSPLPVAAPTTDLDEPAGPWAVFTRVLLPMLLAVGAAVSLLAWIG
jgi:hypothetical protein